MSLRLPHALSQQTTDSVDSALNVEIMEEKAGSLGRAGKLVEKTLAALRACDDTDPSRRDHVRAAADAVYAYFIQRELCGLRDQDAAIPAPMAFQLKWLPFWAQNSAAPSP